MVLLILLLHFLDLCSSFEDVPSMTGFYTDGLDKAHDNIEIVYPERVSKDGSFVSYYIPHYYNIDSVENRPRRTSGLTQGSNKDAIHFFVPIDGEKRHLELWPNLNFISPGLVVERRDARDVENVNKAKISQISQRQCHYNGQIVGKANSSAALSTCYGLAGYIRVPAGDEYFIEPVKDSKPTHDKEHPHITYKRSSVRDRHSGSNCLTKGNAKEAFEERMQWEAMFGDQVRKEQSGVDINELVQGSSVNNPSSHTSFKDKLPPNSLTGDLPLVGKSSAFNSEMDKNIKINSGNQISNNYGYKTELQEVLPHPDNLMKDSSLQLNGVPNANTYFGNKLQQQTFKQERNMGNIKLSDINRSSMKAMPMIKVDNHIQEDQSGHVHETSIGDKSFEHTRFKRQLENKENNLNTMSYKKDDHSEKESIEPTNSKSSFNNVLIENIAETSYKENKRNIDEQNKFPSICNSKEVLGNKADYKIPKDKEEGASAKVLVCFNNNPDQKNLEESLKKIHKPVGNLDLQNNNIATDGYRDNNMVAINEKESLVEGLSIDSESNNSQQEKTDINMSPNTNEEHNAKRDIHLDTSEKSWQLNSNADKSVSKLDASDDIKILSSEDLANKIPEGNSISVVTKNNVENEKCMNVNPTKIEKLNKENLNNDEKIIASAIDNAVKVMDKSKVKKEINSIDGVSKSENIQPESFSRSVNQDDEKNLPCNKISLTNSKDQNSKTSSVFDSNQKLILLKEDDNLKPIIDQVQPIQTSQDKDNHNINEIVISIKTSDNTNSDFKQSDKVVEDSLIKDGSAAVNTDGKQEIKFDNVQNIHTVKTPLKLLNNDKNKRGITASKNGNSIDKDIKSNPSNNQDHVKIGNKKCQALNNGDVEIHQKTNPESRDRSQTKTKRDDTIHLVIETEPEISHANSETHKDIKNTNNAYSDSHDTANLFCQGNNCLDIKPVILNDTSNVAPSSNTSNTNVENAKASKVEKRQIFGDECAAETTTERNLVCFDFYSKMFNLELMITVDYKVVKMHDDDDVENFILTIVNMVSTNFYDKSVGINISIILVRLILLTTCIKELDSDRFNPEELLENFCTWQVLVNPGKDDHPHHHDLAIFVTRMEKCEGQVMGVTYMTSICRPDKACLVCIDEGLLLANTITHQIGHSLGADHDDSQSSGCAAVSPDGITYHMAPTITETSSAWSTCSRDAIIQFVRTQGSWCLTDVPVERSFNFPLMLPGQIYSAAQQCRLNFHMTALPCAVGSFCERLYCQVTEKLCATKGDPPADGTFCASDMWCFHKQCVHIGRRPGAVNGEWGPWTEWSICTRSCGGGVSSSYRICNNPKPANGGRYCIGDRLRHRMCATKPCQGFTESFRDLQCKRTEDRPFRGRLHNWVQYQSFYLNIECALVCQNRKGDVVMRSPIVADGTPCKAGTRNVCIQGVCRNVGCDWVIDSKAKEDSCGMCHGNATECKIVQGVFDEPTTSKGLVEFLRIPKGSGMIFVREISPSSNILVVSGAINRVYYLNGQGNEDTMPGDVSFGLTHGVYEVRSAMERIFIRGPTQEELIFYVLFREPNKGIHYQYAVAEMDPTYVPRYLWQYLDWDPCTDPCSGGSQRAHPKCVEDRGGVVDDVYCTDSSKPMDIIRPCNDFPCQAKWWVSVWSDCICTGSSSVMFRSVLCMRATDESGTRAEIVREAECADHKKPPTQKACNATEEENECVKRDIPQDHLFGFHRDIIRRSINPKIAYVAFAPADLSSTGFQEAETLLENNMSDGKKDEDKLNSSKIQKKSIKPQGNNKGNVKGIVSKLKPKTNDKELLQNDKNKIGLIKSKDAENLKPVASKGEGIEEVLVKDDVPNASGKGKQIAKFNHKNTIALNDESSDIRNSDKNKQADDSDSGDNVQSSNGEEKCESSTAESTCATPEQSTTEPSTCRQTCAVQPHHKTTCCKTTPRRAMNTKPEETTTLRPVVVKMDELNMHNFALTVVPLDLAGKKKLPQSDPEFINLGNIGQFAVADEANGTIISGQEAIDFLEFARSNASEEPVILHEDMHN